MTIAKTIILWGKEDLLSYSIKVLLAIQQNWKVVCISRLKDLAALIQAGETPQQDIVIIHQRCATKSAKLPKKFLQDHPAIKVITVNLENNDLEVYRRQKIIVHQASDLIAAIENEA